MKLALTLGSLSTVLATVAAQAEMIKFTENLAIPIGNPVGIYPAGVVSTIPANYRITDLTVGLEVSGGFNGGLVAYVEAPDGSTVSLLNRPGVTDGNPFGYCGSGLNVSIFDAATASLQTTPEAFGQVVTGNYQAIGSLASFNGLPGNGTWNLYIADDLVGGGQPMLDSWSLDITAVPTPEPSQLLAGAVLVGGALGVGLLRRRVGARKEI